MPVGCDVNFTQWWRSLGSSELVVVHYPHEKHGNACRVSNSTKPSIMNDFISFVDANSQPNGRSAESHGPIPYFISKFATIQTPKKNVIMRSVTRGLWWESFVKYKLRMEKQVVQMVQQITGCTFTDPRLPFVHTCKIIVTDVLPTILCFV